MQLLLLGERDQGGIRNAHGRELEVSTSDESEHSGDERSDWDESAPGEAEHVSLIFRNERTQKGTNRPTELTLSINHLAMIVAGMQGIVLTGEDRAVLEQLIAALANLLS